MIKKVKLLVIAILLIMPMACCEEEDVLSVEDRAKQASAEFCECMKENSLSKCEDKLNTNYGFYADDTDFIKAFNSANKCNITISKKK